MFHILFWPAVACVVFPPLLVYLGLHVLRREIIFIDIAMAQMASLGACAAALLGWEAGGAAAFSLGLGFTLGGAAIFTLAKGRGGAVPLEALIGIVYIVAAAAAVLVLSRTPEGDEHIRGMLIGNILVARPGEIAACGAVFAAVGAAHALGRRAFLAASFGEPPRRRKAWDFAFYALFGIVAASFVRMAGVLLVFSYLILPAAFAARLAAGFAARFALGTAFAVAGGLLGLGLSFALDLPSGAAIVCTLGALAALAFALPAQPGRA
jgi:zinc/manganese transport system permease protein